MFKQCTICKRWYHTQASGRQTCDRIACKDWYMQKNKIKPQAGRQLAVFHNRIEAEKNIVKSVANARKLGMSYGFYTAYKERHWV